MSSSDPRAAGRRFLVILFAGLTLMLGGVITATALVDPTGLLVGAGWSPGLCVPGIKDPGSSAFTDARIRLYQPREIFVGSSRVMRGFDPDSLAGPGSQTAMNLGFSGATMADVDVIVRNAVANAPVERVWIGLDFGAFVTTERNRHPATTTIRLASGRNEALAMGLLSPQAQQATLKVLLHPASCQVPPVDARGFANPAAAPLARIDPAILPNPTLRARMRAPWHRTPTDRKNLYAGELARFTRLMAELKRRNIAVILFVGPTHPAYDSLVAEAGLTRFRVRWRADVARIAREQGAVLVPADRSDFLATLPGLPANCDATPADCAFYDATHFRPFVGTAIIREGRRRSGSPTDPR